MPGRKSHELRSALSAHRTISHCARFTIATLGSYKSVRNMACKAPHNVPLAPMIGEEVNVEAL